MLLAAGMMLAGCTTADGTTDESDTGTEQNAVAVPDETSTVVPVDFDDDSDLLDLYLESGPPHDAVTGIVPATHADAFTVYVDTDDLTVATDVCEHVRQLFLIDGETAIVTVYEDGEGETLAMNVGDLRPECRPLGG